MLKGGRGESAEASVKGTIVALKRSGSSEAAALLADRFWYWGRWATNVLLTISDNADFSGLTVTGAPTAALLVADRRVICYQPTRANARNPAQFVREQHPY